MTYEEARVQHDTFLRETRRRASRLVPAHWHSPTRTEEHDDSWVFVYSDAGAPGSGPYEAVVVRKDRSGPYVLLGAIGQAVRSAAVDLGLPRSNERWLGSGPGRYQAFDGGLVVWHEDPGLAYGRRVSPDVLTGRRCLGLVAFFDLRGFSRWARRRNPRDVQALMSSLEAILQDAFNKQWCRLLFVKGIGDGMMVVSERDWFAPAGGRAGRWTLYVGSRPHPGHASALLQACGQVVLEGRGAIPGDLAIGCGIDVGELNQVFLLGQSDYLGEPANNAAKLQQLAWNEIIVSTHLAEILGDGAEPCRALPGRGVALADRGIRLDPALCT